MKDENNNGIPDDFEVLAKLAAIFLVLLFVGAIVARVSVFGELFRIGGYTVSAFIDVFSATYLPILRLMSVALSTALLIFIIFIIRETNKIIASEKNKVKCPDSEDQVVSVNNDEEEFVVDKDNERWVRVMELISSEYARDWKTAILEADIMLGELLTKIGYRGDSMGEQLKQVERSDFLSINQAWEAHKMRNSIAHEGEEFILSQREAERIIRLFEEVFKEFRYI